MYRLVRALLAAAVLMPAGASGGLTDMRPSRDTAGTLTLHLDQRGPAINPTLFGLMFEDINHSGDGGIYAELVADRNMVDDPQSNVPWATEATGHAQGSIEYVTSKPAGKGALRSSLRLTIVKIARGERVGIVNAGFAGMPAQPSTTYRLSFYARSGAGFAGPLMASLEDNLGRVLATSTVSRVGDSWQHYQLALTTKAWVKQSSTNHLVISGTHTGIVWFSFVSLFPPTWNNRPNGMRVDLMRDLRALNPGFLRFPGGNFLEGQTVATRFNWKYTIGPVALRPGHPDDAWGYWSSDGLGLLGYLEWCEDLHMVPVLAVFAGYALQGTYIPAGPQLAPYVADALDEIQYASGAVTTSWGARRAADGHAAPFTIRYVEVGNEDFFDQSGSYDGRFAQFYNAIKAVYPHMQIIATTSVKSRVPDMIDQHFYESPEWFADNTSYYDRYSRAGPKVMVGEYAARPDGSMIGQGTATLGTALGEAAWMTGLERNADVVLMASYAPLFQNVNAYQWSPDLISYDSLTSYGSPSYYVQQLFGQNLGSVVVPATLSGAAKLSYVASRDIKTGALYVTVVNTSGSAQKVDIKVVGAIAVSSRGTASVLTSNSTDAANSLTDPENVHPVTTTTAGLGRAFSRTFPPDSLTVLHLDIT